jgi:protein-S-isoprenylcysteine O-methyltransferase Ste14
VIAFPPFILLASGVTSGGMALLLPLPVAPNPIARLIGGGLALAAGGLVAWAMRTMRAGGTNIDPGEPALAIVRGGPFRFTRNPMYLSMCLLHASLGFLLNNWIPVAATGVLAAVLNFGVVVREERYLEAKFGERYLALKRSVRRWI